MFDKFRNFVIRTPGATAAAPKPSLRLGLEYPAYTSGTVTSRPARRVLPRKVVVGGKQTYVDGDTGEPLTQRQQVSHAHSAMKQGAGTSAASRRIQSAPSNRRGGRKERPTLDEVLSKDGQRTIHIGQDIHERWAE